MKAKWIDAYNPSSLIDYLNGNSRSGSNGALEFIGFDFDEKIVTLSSMILLPDKLKHHNRESIITNAVILAAKNAPITKSTLIDAVNQSCMTLLRNRERRYIYLSALSIANFQKIPPIVIDGVKLRFVKKYPYNQAPSRKNIEANAKLKRLSPPPSSYIKVIAELKTKDHESAANKASRSIDILRGLFCLLCNAGMELIGDPSNPINRIRTCEYHSLHCEEYGTIPFELWFEASYREAPPFAHKEFDKLRKSVFRTLKKIEKSAYPDRLKNSLTRYARALDEKDQSNAMIRLWGALETLTLEEKQAKYDATVRRTSAIFKDIDHHSQVLQHLKNLRNDIVHQGESTSSIKTCCFQLQKYFRELFMFHIRNSSFFNSFAETNDFLDLPHKAEKLLSQKKLLTKAFKYRELNSFKRQPTLPKFD